MKAFYFVFFFVILFSPSFASETSISPSSVQQTTSRLPQQFEGMEVSEHLGEFVKINELHYYNEKGQEVLLSDFFKKGKPVLLALIYHGCPNLCNLLLNGLMESLKKFDWTPGHQFEIITVSINPSETPQLASKKKEKYLLQYNRPESSDGWHFLTGQESQIQSLASQLGFHYKYDEKIKQYLHTSVIFILTPEGKISRYIYGISFPLKDLRFSLLDASHGNVGTVMDRVLLYCFHFDSSSNSYTFQVWKVVQIILTIQVLIMGLVLFYLWKTDRVKLTRK